jgi:aerobic-type carbon monoxide dehydrogenase small subunit (CoxS/CutS family)
MNENRAQHGPPMPIGAVPPGCNARVWRRFDAGERMVLDRCSSCADWPRSVPALTINGTLRLLDCAPDLPLLWAIREGLGLSGTRPGCLVGLCGACTVHLDGEAVRPCSVTVADAQGRCVTTIEGVLATPLGRALAQVWAAGGLQCCEQCRPGRIMACAALLARCPQPTDAEVDAMLGEHACECGDPGAAGDTLRRAARLVCGVPPPNSERTHP